MRRTSVWRSRSRPLYPSTQQSAGSTALPVEWADSHPSHTAPLEGGGSAAQCKARLDTPGPESSCIDAQADVNHPAGGQSGTASKPAPKILKRPGRAHYQDLSMAPAWPGSAGSCRESEPSPEAHLVAATT